MCMYMYMCMHVYVHVLRVCITCACACMCAYIYVYMYMYVCKELHVNVSFYTCSVVSSPAIRLVNGYDQKPCGGVLQWDVGYRVR